MCGIAGFASWKCRPAKDSVIAMTQSLKHRGPDGDGIFINNTFALGHTRLSIIDIEGGAQPMANEDSSIVIIFNGEIYNYKELRNMLLAKGHSFSSTSDTEVIIHLYEEEGANMFKHLNGMFAIAIADIRRTTLVLARDRLGKKPLFYYAADDQVVFASELKALMLHPAVPRELDVLAAYDYLSLNYVPGVRTLMRHIQCIPPGSAMFFSEHERRPHKYWDVHAFHCDNNKKNMTEDEAVEELDFLLSDAVRLRLRSDVPVGIFLSGGVDSSVIAWKARELGADICGYTAKFSEHSFSEEPYARKVASSLDMDIKVYEITPDINRIFSAIVYHADDPLADSSAVPVYLLSQNTAKDVKVVLGGDGGDEVFAGYLTYPATLLAKNLARYHLMPAVRSANGLINCLPVSERKVSFEYKLKRFMRGLLLPPGSAHFSWNGTWCQWEKDSLLAPDFLKAASGRRDTFAHLAECHHISQYNPQLIDLQKADLCEYLPNDILSKVDRMSMAHGLEVRSPWLDYRIVEWALTIPPELKLRRGWHGKYLLKRYMLKKFPASIVNRSKQGFSIPINKWLRDDLRPLAEDLLSEQALRESGIFNARAVREMFRQHQEKKASFGFEIWGLLVFMVWHKNVMHGWRRYS